jgi:hypothetical protein
VIQTDYEIIPDKILAQSQRVEPKVHGEELIDNEKHSCFLGSLFTERSVGLQNETVMSTAQSVNKHILHPSVTYLILCSIIESFAETFLQQSDGSLQFGVILLATVGRQRC